MAAVEGNLQPAGSLPDPDPIARYAGLYGGHNPRRRARPGDPAWGRLKGFGPAFFTKFSYFTTPGALILDHRLASAVHNASA